MKYNDVKDILKWLEKEADPSLMEFKLNKFGIEMKNALGLSMKQLNELVKNIEKSDQLALELYDTEVYEARIICGKIFKPKSLTMELAESWVQDFHNWEICDTFSMKIFGKSPIAKDIIYKWHDHADEFIKRAAFATMAAYCSDRDEQNDTYDAFYELILQQSTDDRNFVKKAVNWALRSIGKRNPDLQQSAIEVSKQLISTPSKSAQWIGKDALKELSSPSVRMSNYPRSKYLK